MREPVTELILDQQQPAPAVILNPIDENGFRECALDECAQKFNVKHGERGEEIGSPGSRAYCSEEHAAVGFFRRHGMTFSPSAVARVRKLGETKEQQETRATRELLKDERYGPLREVGATLNATGTRRVTRLEPCGHQKSVGLGTKHARCSACRAKTAEEAADAPVPVRHVRQDETVHDSELRRPVREPVRELHQEAAVAQADLAETVLKESASAPQSTDVSRPDVHGVPVSAPSDSPGGTAAVPARSRAAATPRRSVRRRPQPAAATAKKRKPRAEKRKPKVRRQR